MGRERGRGESRRRRRCSRHRGNKGGGNKERQVARRSAAGQGAAPRTKARPGRAELLAGRDPAGRTHRGSGPDIGGGAVTSAGGGGSERGREEGPAPAAPRPGRRERAPPPAGGEAERPQPSRHGTARPAPRLLRLPPRGCPRRRPGAAPGRSTAVFLSAPRTHPRTATFAPRVPSNGGSSWHCLGCVQGVNGDRLCWHSNLKGFQNFGGGWASFCFFFSLFLSFFCKDRKKYLLFVSFGTG